MAEERSPGQARKSAELDDLIKLSESPGWDLLMRYCLAEAADAHVALVDTDPYDSKSILTHQNAIKRLHWFQHTIEIMMAERGSEEDVEALPEDGYDDVEPQ